MPRSSASPSPLLPASGRRQFGPPNLPQRLLCPASSAIEVQPLLPLLNDPVMPAGTLFGESRCAPQHGPQHIEIVDLAQGVLQIAEITRPFLVPLRQKILHRIAESFDTDPQLVISQRRCDFAWPRRCNSWASVQRSNANMLKDRAFERDAIGALGQVSVQRSPLFPVEALQRLLRGTL